MSKLLLATFIINLTFLSCSSMKKNTPNQSDIQSDGTQLEERKDILCSELTEFKVLETFPEEKSDIRAISSRLIAPFTNGVTAKMYSDIAQLENGIKKHIAEYIKHYGNINGSEFIQQETTKVIAEKVDFDTQNLIIISINSGGPPFHKIQCKLEGDLLYIKGVKPKTMISGAALLIQSRFFTVEKRITLK